MARALGAMVLAMLATGQAASFGSAAVDTGTADLHTVLARAAEDVTRFERPLSSVILEERYVQVVKPWLGKPPTPRTNRSWRGAAAAACSRRGARTVRSRGGSCSRTSCSSVDRLPRRRGGGRKAIRDRADRVQRLFLSKSAEARAPLGRISRHSARLNLGTYRTMNTPTYILQVLHPRWQPYFAFAVSSSDAVDDDCCIVLSYRETAKPTMTATSGGHDIPLQGSIWIEPESGRVRRTVMELDETRWNPRAVLDVTYRPLSGLDVLVPGRMWDWYYSSESRAFDSGSRYVARSYVVEGLPTYANVRRFTVTTSEAPAVVAAPR